MQGIMEFLVIRKYLACFLFDAAAPFYKSKSSDSIFFILYYIYKIIYAYKIQSNTTHS